MDMITNLNITSPEIMPGREIDVEELKLSNHRLHCVGMLASEMVLAALEGESNNSKATMRST